MDEIFSGVVSFVASLNWPTIATAVVAGFIGGYLKDAVKGIWLLIRWSWRKLTTTIRKVKTRVTKAISRWRDRPQAYIANEMIRLLSSSDRDIFKFRMFLERDSSSFFLEEADLDPLDDGADVQPYMVIPHMLAWEIGVKHLRHAPKFISNGAYENRLECLATRAEVEKIVKELLSRQFHAKITNLNYIPNPLMFLKIIKLEQELKGNGKGRTNHRLTLPEKSVLFRRLQDKIVISSFDMTVLSNIYRGFTFTSDSKNALFLTQIYEDKSSKELDYQEIVKAHNTKEYTFLGDDGLVVLRELSDTKILQLRDTDLKKLQNKLTEWKVIDARRS